MSERKKIALLGSTGSIGTQALEVIRRQKDFFEVEVLSSFNNVSLLIKQAEEFQPNAVVIGDEKTPANWRYQKTVYAGRVMSLHSPFNSYARKNAHFVNISNPSPFFRT